MSVILPPNSAWRLRRRAIGWPAALMVALLLVAVAALWEWQSHLDSELATAEARLQKVAVLAARAAPRVSSRSLQRDPVAERQRHEQVLLLNRDWPALTEALTPRSSRIRVLSVEANPASGAVRVGGRADSATRANAYARRLQGQQKLLADVRLLALEWRPDGVYFEVDAQWLP